MSTKVLIVHSLHKSQELPKNQKYRLIVFVNSKCLKQWKHLSDVKEAIEIQLAYISSIQIRDNTLDKIIGKSIKEPKANKTFLQQIMTLFWMRGSSPDCPKNNWSVWNREIIKYN